MAEKNQKTPYQEEFEDNKDKRDQKEKDIQGLFSERLKSIRETNKTRPSKVSHDTGINPSMISAYEEAEKAPNVMKAKILADYFGVSLDWLCGGNPDARTLLNKKDPWLNIPTVYAFLAILNKYSPEITIGDGKKEPYVTLSFRCKKIYSSSGEPLQEFFNSYIPITLLEDYGHAEAIDLIANNLIEKYIDKL